MAAVAASRFQTLRRELRPVRGVNQIMRDSGVIGRDWSSVIENEIGLLPVGNTIESSSRARSARARRSADFYIAGRLARAGAPASDE